MVVCDKYVDTSDTNMSHSLFRRTWQVSLAKFLPGLHTLTANAHESLTSMTYYHGNHFSLKFFLIFMRSLQACINPWLPIWCIAMEIGRSERGLLTTPHIPASWRAVSCEGEPDKGQGLSWGLSPVPGEKVLKTLLYLWLQDVKVGGVIRASNRGDVGWENWREREWGLQKWDF